MAYKRLVLFKILAMEQVMVMMKKDQRPGENQRKGNNGGVKVSRRRCLLPFLAKAKTFKSSTITTSS